MTIREAVCLVYSNIELANLSIRQGRYAIATKACLMALKYLTSVLIKLTETLLYDDNDMKEVLEDLQKVIAPYSLLFAVPPSFWFDSNSLPMVEHMSKFKINKKTTVPLYEYTKRVVEWGDISTYEGEDKESILQLTIG